MKKEDWSVTGNWRWKHVNQHRRKAARFYERYGFWPTEEACECTVSRALHHPKAITHTFVSTKKKA
jgi:hypothetical protein